MLDKYQQAGIGDDFLAELLNNNAKQEDSGNGLKEQKKAAEEEDVIQLIEFSEHQFI